MAFIEYIFQIYFVFLLIRLLIPDTGQMAFNRVYQLTVKFTDPVLSFLGRAFPSGTRRMVPLLAIFILILIQGLIYNGYGSTERILSLGIENWRFKGLSSFWGWAKSLAFYLIFIYRFFAFLLLIVLFSPFVDSSDQLARLVKGLIRPFLKLGRGKFSPLAILFLLFSLILTLLWSAYGKLDYLDLPGLILLRSALCAAVLLIGLLSLFTVLIVVRVIFSWLNIFGIRSGSVELLFFVTEPFLSPLRRLNLRIENWDFTPLVAIFILIMVKKFLFLALGGIYHSLPVI